MSSKWSEMLESVTTAAEAVRANGNQNAALLVNAIDRIITALDRRSDALQLAVKIADRAEPEKITIARAEAFRDFMTGPDVPSDPS